MCAQFNLRLPNFNARKASTNIKMLSEIVFIVLDALPASIAHALFSPTRELLCYHVRHRGDTYCRVGHVVGNLATASDIHARRKKEPFKLG